MTQSPNGGHVPDDDALTLFHHLTDTTDEVVEILHRGRAEVCAGIVRPQLSAEEGRAIYARLKAMMDQ